MSSSSYLGLFPENAADFSPDLVIEFMKEHTEVPIFAVSLYLGMVFWVPQQLTKPLNLKIPFVLWNVLLSIFSIMGVTQVVPPLVQTLWNEGLMYSICADPTQWFLRGSSGLWLCYFILSKMPELLDTAFLVLQKKSVIFLHWFHHVTVLLYCWHAYRHRVSTGLWFTAMNFSVHSVMYAYYAVSIMGYSRFARPVAPLITFLQLLQMLVGSAVTSVSAYMHYHYGGEVCYVTASNYKLGLGMYLSYFILFAVLFYNNYLAPNARHRTPRNKLPSDVSAHDTKGVANGSSSKSDAAVKDNNTICGVDMTSLRDDAGFFHGASAGAPASPTRAGEKKRN